MVRNIDKIQTKTVSEMQSFICDANLDRCRFCAYKEQCQIMNRESISLDCEKGIREWLRMEAEDAV